MTTIIVVLALGVVALFLARTFLVGLAYIASAIPPSIAVPVALVLFAALVLRLFLALGGS